MEEIYLDNAATTRVVPKVAEKINHALTTAYGNPSSLHNKGLEAEKLVKTARRAVADQLQVGPEEIYFTSGGTEANNLAILGAATALTRYGNQIITTPIEHASVRNTIQHLVEAGWEVEYLEVDEAGTINLEQLEELVSQETVLVSIIGVNNELGSLQPLAKIAQITAQYDNLYLHVDGIQALGKVDIFPAQLGIDLFSVSAHKIHGPKGVGALYINSDIQVPNILHGSEQEAGIRPGTENVPGIVGFGRAVELLPADKEHLYQLKEELITKVTNQIEQVKVNGPTVRKGAPHIVSLSFAGIKGEVLVHSLEEEGIYVSTGSACHSRHSEPSQVLQAIEVGPKYIDGTLRFSFSYSTTQEEIDYTVETLQEKVEMLRKYM